MYARTVIKKEHVDYVLGRLLDPEKNELSKGGHDLKQMFTRNPWALQPLNDVWRRGVHFNYTCALVVTRLVGICRSGRIHRDEYDLLVFFHRIVLRDSSDIDDYVGMWQVLQIMGRALGQDLPVVQIQLRDGSILRFTEGILEPYKILSYQDVLAEQLSKLHGFDVQDPPKLTPRW